MFHCPLSSSFRFFSAIMIHDMMIMNGLDNAGEFRFKGARQGQLQKRAFNTIVRGVICYA